MVNRVLILFSQKFELFQILLYLFELKMDKNKNAPPSPTPAVSKSEKSEKKEPLSLEELLAKKKAEELARSKVSVFFNMI